MPRENNTEFKSECQGAKRRADGDDYREGLKNVVTSLQSKAYLLLLERIRMYRIYLLSSINSIDNMSKGFVK